MKRHLVETGDGSHSLFVPALNEQYHSWHGALSESRHVFVEMGLRSVVAGLPAGEAVRILEIGFGTGLNALLTLQAGDREVWYTGVEAYPLLEAEVQQLNYPAKTGEAHAAMHFAQLHAVDWGGWQVVVPDFHLFKMNARIEDFRLDERVHLVYFDAFAPDKQPELWTSEVFARMYEMLLPGGRLTTYCAKGAVRRTMASVGFSVERCAGPPGKREMLCANKLARV
ncbi:MAG TPA: SAM-dependent methyltransferase [Bacteroidetes bacterium]|nr:SAM-dependent methyltransferase [Bacteroidota bacterium]